MVVADWAVSGLCLYFTIGNLIGTYVTWLAYYTNVPITLKDTLIAILLWPWEIRDIYKLSKLLLVPADGEKDDNAQSQEDGP